MNERYHPRSLAEVARAVSQSAVGGGVLEIQGRGTKLGWLRSGQTAEATLDTTGLTGVLRHDKEGMMATVRAGTPLAEFKQVVHEGGQRFGLDPPLGPEGLATVGGSFACDDAGPARIAYGSPRDLALGITVVLSDGTVARTGGRVLRRVAGYDLSKLYCGSRGTLGLVAELNLRLHPRPPREVTLRAPLSVSASVDFALRFPGRSPATGLTHQGGALWIRLEGRGEDIDACRRYLSDALERRGVDAVDVLEMEASRDAWAEATEGRRANPGETTLACSSLPSAVGKVAEVIQVAARKKEIGARLVADPLLGLVLVHLAPAPGDEGLKCHAGVVIEARARTRDLGASIRLRGRPRGLDTYVDPEGSCSDRQEALIRAVKQRLDPVGRCMPGRYWARV